MRKILFIGLSLMILASCGEPTINGKLLDNFNNPIENAKVEVEGTAFTANTNSKGEYEINFVPGTITLKYTKKNYLDTILKIGVSTKDDFPAQVVRTYKVPNGGDINYIDKDRYIALEKSPIKIGKTTNRKYVKWGDYYNNLTGLKIVSYYASKEKILKIKQTNSIQFVDTSTEPIALVKLDKTANGLKILSTEVPLYNEFTSYGGKTKRTYFAELKWSCHARSYYLNNKFLYFTKMKTEYTSLNSQNQGKTFGIRTYKGLSKGYYAFVFNLRRNVSKPLNTKYAMVFEVE